jgi:hypothetical protein
LVNIISVNEQFIEYKILKYFDWKKIEIYFIF